MLAIMLGVVTVQGRSWLVLCAQVAWWNKVCGTSRLEMKVLIYGTISTLEFTTPIFNFYCLNKYLSLFEHYSG